MHEEALKTYEEKLWHELEDCMKEEITDDSLRDVNHLSKAILHMHKLRCIGQSAEAQPATRV